MWHLAHMLFADRPAAEYTRSVGGPLAVPTVHGNSFFDEGRRTNESPSVVFRLPSGFRPSSPNKATALGYVVPACDGGNAGAAHAGKYSMPDLVSKTHIPFRLAARSIRHFPRLTM